MKLIKYFKRKTRLCLNKMGFDIIRHRSKNMLHNTYEINLVLDVGANTGQYAEKMRCLGYRNHIISFEPLSSAFKVLANNAQSDSLWEVHNFGLGDKESKETINIAGNSYSSSLLPMLQSHLSAAPQSKYVDQEIVKIKTLDSVFDSSDLKGMNILLKIDTQGFEEKVVEGAKNSLNFINTIQLEMSLIPLYEGELLFNDLYQLLFQKGYRLVSIEQGFYDKSTGQLLQVDGIFHRFSSS